MTTNSEELLPITRDTRGVVTLTLGHLSAGFASPADGLVVISTAQIFGARRAAPRQKAASKKARDALLGGVSDFSQLAVSVSSVVSSHPRCQSGRRQSWHSAGGSFSPLRRAPKSESASIGSVNCSLHVRQVRMSRSSSRIHVP